MKCKKFLSLMCFFAVFLFIGSSDVYGLTCKKGEDGCTQAAIEEELNEQGRELACLYEMTFSNGETYYGYIYYRRAYVEGTKYDELYLNLFAADQTYKEIDNYKYDLFYNGNSYYENKLELKSCPKSYYMTMRSASTKPNWVFNVCFDDLECKGKESSSYFSGSESILIKDKMDSIIFKRTDRYTEYIDNENYCIYNVSGDDYSWIVYSKEKNAIFFDEYTSKLRVSVGLDSSKNVNDNTYNLSIDSSSNSCPNQIYYAKYKKNYYFSDQYIDNDKIKDKDRKTYVLYEKTDIPDPVVPDKTDCTLFDDNLREIINGVMDIIKIAVPLLLIGLIGLDFGKAIFASDEKAISKAKKNAITRIIVAIVIYFVPTLLNLLFNIANDVWTDVHYEVCVLNEDVNKDDN